MSFAQPVNRPDRWNDPAEPFDGSGTGLAGVPPGELEFRHQALTGDDRHLVAVFGEIDLATASKLRTELLTALVRRSPRLVLDLSGVTFLDSTGLAALVAVHRRAHAAGGELAITGPRPVVRKLLGITYLDRVFPFYEDLNARPSP